MFFLVFLVTVVDGAKEQTETERDQRRRQKEVTKWVRGIEGGSEKGRPRSDRDRLFWSVPGQVGVRGR